MSNDLTNTFISDTYIGVIHTIGDLPLSGKTNTYDGLGNMTSISIGRVGQGVDFTGDISATGKATFSGRIEGESINAGSLAFGKVGEGGSIVGDTNITGNLVTTGSLQANNITYPTSNTATNLFNLIYPIGSVYLSMNDVNPGTYWTGTVWEKQSQGRYITGIGQAPSYTVTFVSGNNDGSFEETYNLGMVDHIHGVGDFGWGGNDDCAFIAKEWTNTTTFTGRGITGDGGGGGSIQPPRTRTYGIVTSSPLDPVTGLPIESTATIEIKPPSFGVYVWVRTA